MQPLRLRPRPHPQLRVERLAAHVVLVHGSPAQSLAQPGVHQDAVGQFLGGAGREDLLGDGDRVGRGPPVQVLPAEAEQQLLAQEGESAATVVGPARVTVLRQDLTGEEVEGGRQRVHPAVGQGRAGRRLGLVRVDAHGRRIKAEESPVGDQVRGGGAGEEFRFEGVAGAVKGDAQAARGGPLIGVGPAGGDYLLPVEAVPGYDCEELDQGARTGARPPFRERGPPSRVARKPPRRRRRSNGAAGPVPSGSRTFIKAHCNRTRGEPSGGTGGRNRLSRPAPYGGAGTGG